MTKAEIRSDLATLPLLQWQRDLLDERLASADAEEGKDWEDVKAEIWTRPGERLYRRSVGRPGHRTCTGAPGS